MREESGMREKCERNRGGKMKDRERGRERKGEEGVREGC